MGAKAKTKIPSFFLKAFDAKAQVNQKILIGSVAMGT